MAEAKTIPMPSVNLIDESFDTNKSNEYHLSILASENGFAYAILDTNTNKYLVLQNATTLKGVIEQIQHLPLGRGATVTCAVAHNKFTLIPSALFDEENKESLLGFNHEVKSDEEIFSNTLHNLEAKNLFTVSKSLVAEIRKQFPNANFIHSSTSFIEGLLVQHKNNSGKKVFANFHSPLSSEREVGGEAYFEIVILDGKELLFSNAFSYKTPEDIAYYILFVYEQLNLNPEMIELVLSGEIEKTAKEHSLLYTYIRNVKFASRPDGFKYSYKFEEMSSHKFFSLFTQYLCA